MSRGGWEALWLWGRRTFGVTEGMDVFALRVHFSPFKPITSTVTILRRLSNMTSPIIPAISLNEQMCGLDWVGPSKIITLFHDTPQHPLYTTFTRRSILRSITSSIEPIRNINSCRPRYCMGCNHRSRMN